MKIYTSDKTWPETRTFCQRIFSFSLNTLMLLPGAYLVIKMEQKQLFNHTGM